jgi:hypothetical protein
MVRNIDISVEIKKVENEPEVKPMNKVRPLMDMERKLK